MAKCYLCSTYKGKVALEQTAVLMQRGEFEEVRLPRCQACLDDIALLQKSTSAARVISVAAWVLVLIPFCILLMTLSVLTLGDWGYLLGGVGGLVLASNFAGLLGRFLRNLNRSRLRDKLKFPQRVEVDVEKVPAVASRLAAGWDLAGTPLTAELPEFYKEMSSPDSR